MDSHLIILIENKPTAVESLLFIIKENLNRLYISLQLIRPQKETSCSDKCIDQLHWTLNYQVFL